MLIRLYKEEDFNLLNNWWKERKEIPPTKEMMPPHSYIIEDYDGMPLASMCLILTDLKAVAYCAHFISDKNIDNDKRHAAVKELFKFINEKAKREGYKHLLAFGYQPKLTEGFKKLGFRHTAENLNSFVFDL